MLGLQQEIFSRQSQHAEKAVLDAAQSVICSDQIRQLHTFIPDEDRRSATLKWAKAIYDAKKNGDDILSSGLGKLLPGAVWFDQGLIHSLSLSVSFIYFFSRSQVL
jgi:hypothetical protein